MLHTGEDAAQCKVHLYANRSTMQTSKRMTSPDPPKASWREMNAKLNAMCIRLKRRGVGKKGGPGPTASDPTKRAKQDKQVNQGTRPQGTPHDQAARPTPKGRGLPKTSRAKPAAGVETPRAKSQQQAGEPAPPPPHSPKEAEPNTCFTTRASGQTGKQIRRPRKRPDYLGGHITIVRVRTEYLD